MRRSRSRGVIYRSRILGCGIVELATCFEVGSSIPHDRLHRIYVVRPEGSASTVLNWLNTAVSQEKPYHRESDWQLKLDSHRPSHHIVTVHTITRLVHTARSCHHMVRSSYDTAMTVCRETSCCSRRETYLSHSVSGGLLTAQGVGNWTSG